MSQSAEYNASGDTIHSVAQGEHVQVTNNFYNNHPQPRADVEPDATLPPAEFIQRYQQALHADTEIAQMQILGMTHALNVADIYVKVRVHTRTRPGSLTVDDAKKMPDPIIATEQYQAHMTERAQTAIDPEIALKQHRYCMIVGDPGAGKTTLLKRLTLIAAAQKLPGLPTFPIYIRLNAFARATGTDLFDYAVETVAGYDLPLQQTRTLLQEYMRAGKVLLLLDGLDETVVGDDQKQARETYHEVTQAILAFKKRFIDTRIIITSRKANYFQHGQLTGFTELEALEFLPREIAQFIHQWFAHTGIPNWQRIATSLNEKIRQKPRIATLAANPLLLSLIIIVYQRENQRLPRSRASLYEECVKTLLSKWDTDRSVQRIHILESDDQKALLEQIAYHFHTRRLRYFPKAELLAIIDDFLSSLGLSRLQPEEILKEISTTHGLIREQAVDVYGFLHLTLQEFFTARHPEIDDAFLLQRAHDPWWEEVILLRTGTMHDAGPFLQALVATTTSDQRDDIFYSRLLLAGRCLATGPTMRSSRQLREEIPRQLFALFGYTHYTFLQRHTTEIVAEIGSMYPEQTINQTLMNLLTNEHTEPNRKAYILSALSHYGAKSLAYDVFTLFKTGQFEWIYEVSSIFPAPFLEDCISMMCDETILPELMQMFRGLSNPYVGYVNLAELLGRVGGEKILSYLIEIYDDPAVELYSRNSIPRVMGQYGNQTHLDTLNNWFLKGDNHATECIDALVSLNHTTVGPLLLTHVQHQMLPTSIRLYIIRAMIDLGDTTLIPDLLSLLDDLQVAPELRSMTARTITILGDDTRRQHMITRIVSNPGDSPVTKGVLQALTHLRDSNYLTSLLPLHHSTQLPVDLQHDLIVTLGMLGDRTVLPDLIQKLREEKAIYYPDIGHMIKSVARYSTPQQVFSILKDHSYNLFLRNTLIYALSERADVAENGFGMGLLDVINRRALPELLRTNLIRLLGETSRSRDVLDHLLPLLFDIELIDDVYQALWSISRRIGVTLIYADDGQVVIRNRPT